MDKNKIVNARKKMVEVASTAAGAVTGNAISSAAMASESNLENAEELKVVDVESPDIATKDSVEPQVLRHEPQPASQMAEVAAEELTDEKPGPDPIQNPEPDQDLEIQVLSYERFTTDDGEQAEVALVNDHGVLHGYFDYDLDGYADMEVVDVNGNDTLDIGEQQIIEGQGPAMQPFAEQIGYNPSLAENNIPDYDNTADTGEFMA